jgi:signal peptidase I
MPANLSSPSFRPFITRLFLGRSPKKTLLRILVLVTVCFITFKFVLVPVKIVGHSMEPTCQDGQLRFINLLAYAGRQPQRGDIIGIRLTPDDTIIIKRLIGLPGERIAFHTGVVFINGIQLDEPYLNSLGAWEWPEETLDKNTYFATGDNRLVTQQYRIQREQIFGKFLGLSR